MNNTKNREIIIIDELYHKAISLIEDNLIEASLMYCRKMVEGVVLIIQDKEKIRGNKIELSTKTLYHLEKLIKDKYNIDHTELFFDNLRLLQKLGNEAVHFNLNKNNPSISRDSILFSLDLIFRWFKSYILNFHFREESSDIYFDRQNISLPFCIKNIEITNYQYLEKIDINDIPVDSKFIVLTGDNGEGKTSILQAIAIGIYGDYDESSNLILSDQVNTNITIEGKNNNTTFFNEYKGFRNQFTNIEPTKDLIAYGASRLQLQSSESQDQRNSRQSNVYGIFKTDNILLNIEYWLKIQLLNKQDERIEATISLLCNLMPSITDIRIGHRQKPKYKNTDSDFTNDFPITYIENGRELRLEQLSAGNKSVLAMIGDMLIRLFNSQSRQTNPKNLYGVVLIDELETHLHPKWQKEFPKLLTESFPLVQFFVSTHSPLVFLGMPKNSVFYNISRNSNNFSIVQKLEIDIENIMPHQILTSSLFGMENIRNVYNKGIEYLSVETEIEKKERITNERELKRISEGFKFQLPKS